MCVKTETMCERVSLKQGVRFKVAEPEKQVTQTKTQEMAYCETTKQSQSWNET